MQLDDHLGAHNPQLVQIIRDTRRQLRTEEGSRFLTSQLLNIDINESQVRSACQDALVYDEIQARAKAARSNT